MKFERFLAKEAVPEWRPKYLNYHLLKEHLKLVPLNSSNPNSPSKHNKQFQLDFSEILNQELTKITQFHTKKQSELISKSGHCNRISKQDLINLYTEVEFLKSFQSLNSTALRKIIKKYLKVTGTSLDFDCPNSWKDSKLLDQLTRDIEDLFTVKFYNGDRHRAMRRLRLRNFRSESFHTSAYFSGLLWGSTALIILYIATNKNIPKSRLFYSLAGQFGLFLALGLFNLNTLVFKRSLINYQFVFQFDKRTCLHECQLAALSSFLAFTFVAISLPVLLSNPQSSMYWFAILPLLVNTCLFFNPTPFLWSSSRFWMIKRLVRILFAPFTSVEFPDFFINDHLISQVNFFQGIIAGTTDPNAWTFKMIMIFPNFTRVLQCLRRYWDTKITLNLLNASKYSLNILVIISKTFLSPSNSFILIVLQGTCSLFLIYWDLVMDFGLLKDGNLLRKQLLIFPSKSIYYYLILFDIASRFSWILRLFDTKLGPENQNLLLSFIEMIRRFHWTFLRIEYEHLNNCNSFRAVQETQKPIEDARTADLFYKDMDEEEDAKIIILNEEEEEAEEDTV